MTEQDKQAIAALNTISYGLYIISSKMNGRVNAQCANSLIQVTAAPRRIALGINKHNYTCEFINSSGLVAVSVLKQEQIHYVRHFGLQSGRKIDKFVGVSYITKETGCPILPDALAFLECRVLPDRSYDCGTHILFVCDVTSGGTMNPGTALTYDFYRRYRQ